VKGSLIASQDALVAGFDAAIGRQPGEGASDFPALVMAPQIAASLSAKLFVKPALE
jgi:hypothetical protein